MSEDHEKKSVREILARIEATLEGQSKALELYRAEIGAKIEDHHSRINNHGGRLMSLEHTRVGLHWAGAVVAVIGTALWAKIQDKFRVGP